MPRFDHTPKRKKIESRLTEATIAWLGTVRPDGRPHLIPVWFHWSGNEVLVAARANSQKVTNIRLNPAVTFAIDNSNDGHSPVILEGHAHLGCLDERPDLVGAYFEKYRSTMVAMEWSEQEVRKSYDALIQITINRFIEF